MKLIPMGKHSLPLAPKAVFQQHWNRTIATNFRKAKGNHVKGDKAEAQAKEGSHDGRQKGTHH
jgi:hypothetical protein